MLRFTTARPTVRTLSRRGIRGRATVRLSATTTA